MENLETKECTICRISKSLDEFYSQGKYTKDKVYYIYYPPYCKECTILKSKKWSNENKERQIENFNKWRGENLEYHRNQNNQWYAENKEIKKDYFKSYQQNNPHKFAEYRMLRMSNKKHDITDNEWEACLKYFNYSCAYCGIDEEISKDIYGQKLHKEHVCHKGSNDLSNNVPACKVCNSKKRTKTLQKFAQDYDINEERLRLIEKWIQEDYLTFIES